MVLDATSPRQANTASLVFAQRIDDPLPTTFPDSLCLMLSY